MVTLLRTFLCPNLSIQVYRDLLLSQFGANEVLPCKDSLPQPTVLVEKLSERELEILRLIAAGLSNGQIARSSTYS